MFKKLIGSLFKGGGAAESRSTEEAEAVEYRGFLIVSRPQEQGGQYRVSGFIRKPIEGGETLEHAFERSDLVPGREACDALMRQKAERYIDEVGDGMFSSD
ncbi:hypothetical protein LCL99_03485 [Halomonas denitrificans]|uniref:HlyU family transcriptional regulator n=1 Tax=Halomonas TaxID=2745 RepID=UPI001A8D1057|nr:MULTISPECIES: HlyU family transcriptional regulator [Halomonas]MED5296627.1 HlyU family transcriptional regulator [Pseudomonadota bacterium]MBN8411383.1 hypothetical protein [Halomonas litopenaei]MBY5926001.1 hypothetical protein [Halomonas sp. DP4Y7-2]MBY5927732.1 hypothetical protein [Halomonas sp. DP8Y7-3]MBY5969819.1 hypothetical protein [Halomonas denitrificans]